MIRKALSGLALFVVSVMQQSNAGEPLPLFLDDTIIRAVLTAPIAQVYAQKDNSILLEFPGQWSYVDNDGNNQKLDVAIRPRGHFRREHCDRAPLRLNFKKKQVRGTIFEGQDKLKLVSPCLRGSEYQYLVIREYLAYKTLEILTDYSFKTRLIRLAYVDSDEKLDPWTSLAFVIEDDSDLAKRLDAERARETSVSFSDLDREKTALAELFQLLIGNTDYSVLSGAEENNCCHNSEILIDSVTGLKIPVPYDFDMSGLVDAPYAGPASHVPINVVTDRYYIGLCHPPGVLDTAIHEMQRKREDIVALFKESAELGDVSKGRALRFVDAFFRILDSEKRTQNEIVNRCRGQHFLDKMMEGGADSL